MTLISKHVNCKIPSQRKNLVRINEYTFLELGDGRI